MASKTVIAIAAVVVVAIIGVAAFFALSGSGGDKGDDLVGKYVEYTVDGVTSENEFIDGNVKMKYESKMNDGKYKVLYEYQLFKEVDGVPQIYKAGSEYRYEEQTSSMKEKMTVELDTIWGKKSLKMYEVTSGATTTSMFFWKNLKCEFVIEDAIGDFVFTVTGTDVVKEKPSSNLYHTADAKLGITGTAEAQGYEFDVVGDGSLNAKRIAACAYFNTVTLKVDMKYGDESITIMDECEKVMVWSNKVKDDSREIWGVKTGSEVVDTKLIGKVDCDKYYKYEEGTAETTYVVKDVNYALMFIVDTENEAASSHMVMDVTKMTVDNMVITSLDDLKKVKEIVS